MALAEDENLRKQFRKANFHGAVLNQKRSGLMSEAEAIATEREDVETIIARASTSEDCDLSYCKLSAVPSALMQLTSLVKLNLDCNSLMTLPEDFGSLCFLTHLSLRQNRLQAVPATLCMMDALEVLDISNNLISELPDELSDLKQLQKLVADFNYFTCIPPCVLEGMSSLRDLLLVENPAVVTLPESPAAWRCHIGNPNKRLHLELDNTPEIVASLERLLAAVAAAGMDTQFLDVKWNKIWPDQVVDNVYLGSLRTVQNMAAVMQMNVTHVLTCGRNLRTPFFPPPIKQLVLDVDDSEEENMNVHFSRAISFIEESVAQHGTCIVHCFAGVSRSATVVVAYLMKRSHIRFEQALAFVQEQRPAANPNPNFRRQLVDFERYLGIER
jgi:protein-tyrosine phosphatase